VSSSMFDLPIHASLKRQSLPSADGFTSSIPRDVLMPLKVDTDLKKVVSVHEISYLLIKSAIC
jgi:hypothetical protein